jgi:beta-N-acetylhexosaminidase
MNSTKTCCALALVILLAGALPLATAAAQEDARVEQLLAEMTTREKVAQLFMLPVTVTTLTPEVEAVLRAYPLGGVVLFNQMSSTPSDMIAFTNAMQRVAAATGAGVPLFIAADQEGWPVARLREGFTIFPSNMAVAAAEDGRYTGVIAQAAAAEMQAVGFNMNLAPVADVNSNSLNAVIDTRSFGSEPGAVGRLVSQAVQAIQAQGVIATAKHFPGHGNTYQDSHEVLPVSQQLPFQLEQVELVPFHAAIDAGVEVVMVAHIAFPLFEQTPNLPATLSERIVYYMLREQMGFEGVIMTDSMMMGAVTEQYSYTEAAELAFRAGVDILAYGTDQPFEYADLLEAIDHLADLVERGELSTARLDQSVRRVLDLKARYGLLDWAPLPQENAARVGTVFNDALVENVAQGAVTLVSDGEEHLPLDPAERVVMVYSDEVSPWLPEIARSYDQDVILLPVGFDPSGAEIDMVQSYVGPGERVVVFTCNVRDAPGQVDLLNAFDVKQVVMVALCSPYDLLSFPAVSTFLTSYWELSTPVEAVMNVLYGLLPPAGALPVAVPPYTAGYGLREFPGMAAGE